MAKTILMPKQGNTVESCLILEWKKRPGETVHTGDVLCEVETDKAAFEVEAEADGVLLKLLFEAGADVPVMQPIAIIGQPGEDISALLPPTSAVTSPSAAAQAPVVVTPTAPVAAPVTAEAAGISPRARNLAAAKGLAVTALPGSGPDGRIIERDIVAQLAQQQPLTPAASAALSASGATAPAVGTGPGGRIRAVDVVAQQLLSAPAPVAAAMDFPGTMTTLPVKGVRKIIAARMLESLTTTAQLTLNASADASKLLAYRQRLKNAPAEWGVNDVTINDLVLYAVAKTLPRFKSLNAHFLGDTMKEFDRVHLGMAVDSPRGLLVPHIKHADLRSLKSISQEAKRLGAACRAGSVLPDELSGATFTITNLGALGVESFTPVLNPPEVGILGVCAIQPRPVMDGDAVKFVPHLGLSLTFDHRAVDGAPAARFLQALCQALAQIDLLLAG